MAKFYIGLMAGTSLDGVDCAIVDADIKLAFSHFLPYPQDLKQKLQNVNLKQNISLKEFADLNIEIANIFAEATNQLLIKSKLNKKDIIAIGSHGQTIYHQPKKYSLQIGHPAIIAEKTQINVISDFRMNDIAAGGEGAPLAPIFHKFILKDKNANIINLGGITNISIINKKEFIGFDIGPANTLLDNWIKKHKQLDYDRDGLWARSGFVDEQLLNKLLSDNYFKKAAPKSTGVEYFNISWLEQYLTGKENPVDVQRTLLELTARTITDNINKNLPVYLCGGGANNNFLVESLERLSPTNIINTTYELGINPDYLEAMAFAYFAKQNIENNALASISHNNKRILGTLCKWK